MNSGRPELRISAAAGGDQAGQHGQQDEAEKDETVGGMPDDGDLAAELGGWWLAPRPLTDLVPTDMMSNIILSGMATVALLSAVFSYCFLYEVTGFDTCGKQ